MDYHSRASFPLKAAGEIFSGISSVPFLGRRHFGHKYYFFFKQNSPHHSVVFKTFLLNETVEHILILLLPSLTEIFLFSEHETTLLVALTMTVWRIYSDMSVQRKVERYVSYCANWLKKRQLGFWKQIRSMVSEAMTGASGCCSFAPP